MYCAVLLIRIRYSGQCIKYSKNIRLHFCTFIIRHFGVRISHVAKRQLSFNQLLDIRLKQREQILFVVFSSPSARPISSHETIAYLSNLSYSTTDPQQLHPRFTCLHFLIYKALMGRELRNCHRIRYSLVYSPRLSCTFESVLPAISRLLSSRVVPVSQHRFTNTTGGFPPTILKLVAVVWLTVRFLFTCRTLHHCSGTPHVLYSQKPWHVRQLHSVKPMERNGLPTMFSLFTDT